MIPDRSRIVVSSTRLMRKTWSISLKAHCPSRQAPAVSRAACEQCRCRTSQASSTAADRRNGGSRRGLNLVPHERPNRLSRSGGATALNLAVFTDFFPEKGHRCVLNLLLNRMKSGTAHCGIVVELHLELMLKIGLRLDTILGTAVPSSELQVCISTYEKPLQEFVGQFLSEHSSL